MDRHFDSAHNRQRLDDYIEGIHSDHFKEEEDLDKREESEALQKNEEEDINTETEESRKENEETKKVIEKIIEKKYKI